MEWWRNSTPMTGGTPNDSAERLLIQYPSGTRWRGQRRDQFPISAPNEDFFLDWALALADLADPPQAAAPATVPADIIDLSKPVTFICGTSANRQALSKDYIGAGTTLTELQTDPVTCGPNGCAVCACSGTLVCVPGPGQCVQCLSDAQCSGDTPNCNLTTHSCECRFGSRAVHRDWRYGWNGRRRKWRDGRCGWPRRRGRNGWRRGDRGDRGRWRIRGNHFVGRNERNGREQTEQAERVERLLPVDRLAPARWAVPQRAVLRGAGQPKPKTKGSPSKAEAAAVVLEVLPTPVESH